jgi:HlyD family secretion protein
MSIGWVRKGVAVVTLVAVVGLALPLLAPPPLEVDLHRVERGPLKVLVSEEGKTRVHERFVVSAPMSGRTRRVELEVGDPVQSGKTVLTQLIAPRPRFYDLRETEESQARVAAAEAQRDLAASDIERAKAELAFQEADLARNRELANKGAGAARALESSEMEVRTRRAALAVAKATLAAKTAELDVARAALLAPQSGADDAVATAVSVTPARTGGSADEARREPPVSAVVAPADGVILRKIVESETTVNAGDALFEVGDVAGLEVVVEMLSEDAVKVPANAMVVLSGWGGEGDLHGRVRRVEPYGFTKVSALGIEEQRVNVIVDFSDSQDALRRLGHGYRVNVAIVVWEAPDVLKVPLGALFREHDRWSVYAVDEQGVVHLQAVTVGHTGQFEAEVTGGLAEGSQVILHPSDRIDDGVHVKARTP